MNKKAAERMVVSNRREPLPVEEVTRRLKAGQDRTWTLHNAGYTEASYLRALERSTSNHDAFWAEVQARWKEERRRAIGRKLARGKRSKIRLGGEEHPLELENERRARRLSGARAIGLIWYWRTETGNG